MGAITAAPLVCPNPVTQLSLRRGLCLRPAALGSAGGDAELGRCCLGPDMGVVVAVSAPCLGGALPLHAFLEPLTPSLPLVVPVAHQPDRCRRFSAPLIARRPRHRRHSIRSARRVGLARPLFLVFPFCPLRNSRKTGAARLEGWRQPLLHRLSRDRALGIWGSRCFPCGPGALLALRLLLRKLLGRALPCARLRPVCRAGCGRCRGPR
mmetsp:Transcript_35312/g.83769  ORF Transcript_35312/g.83769 Transcript_35312/m.83769 type:complete len:209 (-) Transcript_35312:2045-2671(-)